MTKLNAFRHLAAIGVLACIVAACAGAPPTPRPILAVIGQVNNQVLMTVVGQGSALPASAGMGLASGSSLSTADLATAAIDFSLGSGAYLQPLTTVTLLRIALASTGLTVELRLSSGHLIVVMPSGHLDVSTTLGDVSLSSGAALIQFAPSPKGPDADAVTIICLAGNCTVNARVFSGDLSRREQLSISSAGLTVDRTTLSDSDLAGLLAAEAGAAAVAPTLTAWPDVPATPAPATLGPLTTSIASPFPSRTLAPTLSTPTATTPPPPVSDTPTDTATPTATVRPTRRPTRSATPSSTPLPTQTSIPTANATDTAAPPPPHPQPTAVHTPVPTAVPPTAAPTQPPATATSQPPSRTPPPPPSKTPVPPPSKTPVA